jgi:integrase
VENGKLRRDWIDPSLGRMSLRDFWTGVVEPGLTDRLRLTTLDLYRGLWARFIEPNMGGRQLASVTRLDVEHFVGRLVAADVGPASIGAAVRLLHRIFEAALRSRRIPANPAAGVERPALPHTEMRFLTADEVERLVDATPERWQAFVLLSAWCGLRFGEISSLTVRRVDLVRRQLRVEETLSEVSGILHKGPPKTTAKRSVAIPAFLCDLLADYMRRWPPGAGGRIFSSPRGGPVRRSNFRNRVWQPAVEKAGLAPLPFHDLRHTAVALAIEAGAHAKAIQARLGHSSVSMTLDRYGHLMEGLDTDLAERLALRATAWRRPPCEGRGRIGRWRRYPR